ncbi:MAG: hypothetical protein ACR2P2_12735, partial [Nakamurella sp.]
NETASCLYSSVKLLRVEPICQSPVLRNCSYLVGCPPNRERSRVPRSVLARSSIYVVLAPAVVAVVLADIVGVVLTLTFRAYVREVLEVQPLLLVGLSLATLAVIVLITAATLPALRRLTRPDALRTE